MVYYLDNIEITDYVLTEYTIGEKKSLAGDDLVKLSEFTLEIWNETDTFNPLNQISPFFGRFTYESIIEIFQNNSKIYEGNIKKITVSNNRCQLQIVPTLNQIIDRTAIYISEDTTPATAFKNLLTINGLLDYVNLYTYRFSEKIQSDRGLLFDINYYIDSSTTILSAIKTFANISGSDVYFSSNQILFHQYSRIKDNIDAGLTIPFYAIVSDIEIFNDTENIRNQYSYETDGATLHDYVIGVDSRRQWGERSYQNFNLKTGNEIACFNTAALTLAGEDKILKALSPKKYCRFTISIDEFDYPFDLLTIFQFDKYLKNGIYMDMLWAVYEVSWSEYQVEIVALQLSICQFEP